MGDDPAPLDDGAGARWARDAVAYQIFVDRFANGDPGLDPPDVVPWGSAPTRKGFMGGDLPGLRRRLGYLEDLGVNLLILTPVFMAASNHRYDTYDYYRIDPRLGTADDLRLLVADAHERGMRVLLDGVFNHCGRGFYPFFDVMENGASSAWGEWFHVDGYPVDAYGAARYEAWQGVAALPRFNLAHPPAREYLLRVAEYWTRQGIDGWRLDAVRHVRERDFWRDLRDAVRSVDPEAYLLAEIWEDAQPWLAAGYFDGATHYPFRELVVRHVLRRSLRPTELAGRLAYLVRRHAWSKALGMLNLLGSHDTPRLMTLAHGDLARVEMALLLLFFFPGIPALYYGDEVGLEGGKDPDNRRAMEWREDGWNRELRELVQRLIAIRRDSPALRAGRWHTLVADDHRGVCGFRRSCGTDHAILLLHTGRDHTSVAIDLSTLDLPATFTCVDRLAGVPPSVEGRVVHLELPPASSALLTIA
jgi:glycosidase